MEEYLRLPGGSRVESTYIVRVAGLPVSVLDPLRCARSFESVEEIVRLRAWITAEGGQLAEALYGIIGLLSGSPLMPGLVGLRRALHRGRRPGNREWNDDIMESLPNEIVCRITDWISTLTHCSWREVNLRDVLGAEVMNAVTALREVTRHDWFRHALSQASPTLLTELEKWHADENAGPRRKTLVKLAKYVARAAMKTSPYSTFTVSGVGTWTAGAEMTFAQRRRVGSVLELNGLVSQRLIGDVHAGTQPLPLRVNSSAIVQTGKVSFIGRPPREPIITMPAATALLACLRIVGERELCTVDELLDELLGAAPSAGRASAGRASAEQFVGRLIDAGLLEQPPPVADQAAEPVDDLIAWAESSADQEIGRTLRRIRALFSQQVPIGDSRRELERREQLVTAVSTNDSVERRHQVVHESAVFVDPVVTCGAARWRPALEDLEVVRRMLAVFEIGLPARIAMTAFCYERFGDTPVPLLAVHRAVQEEMAGAALNRRGETAHEVVDLLRMSSPVTESSLARSQLPRLRELADLRRQARQAVVNGSVLNSDTAALTGLAGTWPNWISPPESLACYVQTIKTESDISLVLNAAHVGYGRGRSRVLHLIERAGGTPPDGAWRTSRPNHTPAELAGRFAMSMNTRIASVPYEIDYPFTVSDRPAAERIAVNELTVVNDARDGMADLFSERLGMKVVPLHLGNMIELLLPPLARLMIQAFSTSYFAYPHLPLPLESDGFEVPANVIDYPRVNVGRVVLRRALWIAPTALVPVRERAEADAAYLLRLVAWLHRHGIPHRCFFRAWSQGLWRAAWGMHSRSGVLDRTRKPVFVDFANWFLVEVFERMIRSAGPVVMFSEVLPTPEDALDAGDGPVATEFLVELSEGHAEGRS